MKRTLEIAPAPATSASAAAAVPASMPLPAATAGAPTSTTQSLMSLSVPTLATAESAAAMALQTTAHQSLAMSLHSLMPSQRLGAEMAQFPSLGHIIHNYDARGGVVATTEDTPAPNDAEVAHPNHKNDAATTKPDGIIEPQLNDVICGRGKMTLSHPGNCYFRDLILSMRHEYQQSIRRDFKTQVTNDLVHMIRERGGRFLLYDSKTGLWFDVGDEYAREKVSHSLRSRSTFETSPPTVPTNIGKTAVEQQEELMSHIRKRRRTYTRTYQSVVQSNKLNGIASTIIQDQQKILKDLIQQSTKHNNIKAKVVAKPEVPTQS